MKIVIGHPPNYSEILEHLQPDKNTIFAWGDKIYNPSGKEIPEDIIYHEKIHQARQRNNPELWWKRYVFDKDFRFIEELIAYGEQYNKIKENLPNKAVKECLNELSNNLSSLYKLGINRFQAETLIRKYAEY